MDKSEKMFRMEADMPVKKGKKIDKKVVVEDSAEKDRMDKTGSWSNWRLFLFTLVVCLVVFVAGYVYLWIRNYQKLEIDARTALDRQQQMEMENQDYQIVRSKIQMQVNECNTLFGQGSGDFGRFEYCKQFVEWTKTLPQSLSK